MSSSLSKRVLVLDRQRNAGPPQKRVRYETQTQFQAAKQPGGRIPMYRHDHQYHNHASSNVSGVCNYVDVINSCNASNNSPFVHSQSGNPNLQLVPLPLPYRKLDEFDQNFNITGVGNLLNCPLDFDKTNLDFDKMNLNVRHESVVKSLYSDMPRQCSTCGVRFKCQEEHSKHMDWHVRKNRMTKATATTRLSEKPKKSRDCFASTSLWLSAAIGGTNEAVKPAFGERQNEEEKPQQRMGHADENQNMCALCFESLDEFFSHEEDDWMYRDAAYLNIKGSRRIVHVKCLPEPRKVPAKESTKPMVMSAFALVC